ncbi:uncharacterized protein LOC129298493 [Prosopis cineraria]|uniref:uncharacterized protein LOC129284391 n=1 Tax=Prosopis cineraria TaxID=364024 RepID=UPI00240F2C00|nr:uncharacterized protein LOC129284391 [Prosopis cineraria]XP_054792885.1 uncharacterized protein LOC129298493 [Prosopis cineraria]
MSRLRLTMKLQPAKKAWRSFSNRVQSKVNELNIRRVIRTTIQRLVSTFHSLRHFISTKTYRRRHRSLPTRPYSYYNCSSSQHHVQRKNFSVIRIDDLFAEPSSSSLSSSFSASGYAAKGEMRSRGKAEMGNKDLGRKGESSNVLDTIDDAWKVVVAKSPNLQVDEKAEVFIKKFHQDIKLQKERSLLEFQERLARST